MTETSEPRAPEAAHKRRSARRWAMAALFVGLGVFVVVLLVIYRDRARTWSRERACDGGDVDTCLALSNIYLRGKEVQKDEALSTRFHQRAVDHLSARCQGGDAESCMELAPTLHMRERTEEVRVKSTEAYERACALGLARGCRYAAYRQLPAPTGTERPVLPTDGKFAEFLVKACRLGDDRQCMALAGALLSKGHGREAVPLLQSACDHNVTKACYDLAELLRGRFGVDVHLERSFAAAARAVALLEKECDTNAAARWELYRDSPHACGMLGNLLNAGRGAPRDLRRVRDLWQTACNAGDIDACALGGDPRGRRATGFEGIELATPAEGRKACKRGDGWVCLGEAKRILRDGKSVHDDPRSLGYFFARASTLLGKACDDDDVNACRVVGDLRKLGLGLARDIAGAERAYDKAARLVAADCDQRDADRCAELARMYAEGGVVAADWNRALESFNRAHEILSQACNHPEAGADPKEACDRLAALLRDGKVVPARVK